MAKREVGRSRGLVVRVRDRDQDASTLLISNPALSEPKSDFRHTQFSTIHIVLYLSGKRLKNAFHESEIS